MANYIGFARSNYFKVNDTKKFEELCDKWNLRLIKKDDLVGFLDDDTEGGLPNYAETEDGEDLEFDDFLKELSDLLVEDEVAIMIEIGYEKMRYLVGFALAINSKGEQVTTNLSDIYKKAESLGKNITTAES